MSKPISQREARMWRKRAKAAEEEVARLRQGFDSEIESYWLPIRTTVGPQVMAEIRTASTLKFRVEASIFSTAESEINLRAVRRREGKG